MTIKDKKQSSLIYLSRSGVQYYAKNLPAPIGFNFPPTLVKDLEIRNIEELNTLVKSFVDQAKIQPTELTTIIAEDLCVQKDFEVTGKKETDDAAIEQFIDAIPFDYVHYKTYHLGKVNKVLAVNRDFYESIQSALTKNGFTIGYTLLKSFPGSIIAADNFGPALNKRLQGKEEWIKQNDFAGLSRAQTVAIDQLEQSKNNKNTWILLGIMGLMIAILATMIIIFKPFTQEKPKRTIPSASEVIPVTPVAPAPVVIPPPVVAPTASPASASAETARIEILNGSGIPGQADTVRRGLTAVGFSNISTGNAPTVTRTTVNYLGTVSPVTLDKMVSLLRTSYPSLLSQPADNLTFDIVITLGKDRVANQTTP